MRIFAIIYCYPPLLVPATMCYLKLIVGMKALGHDIEVLTIVPESFNAPAENLVDLSLNRLVPDGVVNHEVWSWENSMPVRMLKHFSITHKLAYRLLEPRKKEWVFPALQYLRKNIDFSSYDAILSCSQPHVNHLIGLYLKQKHGKPWIAYLSDPWSDLVWYDKRSEKVARYNLSLERKVIENADAVLFTSQETVDLVMKKYNSSTLKKVDVLPHSFVPDWYNLERITPAIVRDRRIEILHTGHFYGLRTPMPVFDVLERLNREVNLTEKIHLTFLGGMEESYKQYVKDHHMDSFITVSGTVPYLKALGLMMNSDYLLVVDAPLRHLSESVFLPSKLVDYFGSDKPVIAVTPSVGTTARVLRETGNLSCDVSDTAAIYRLFVKLTKGDITISPIRERIMDYHYLTTSNKLLAIVKKCCTDGMPKTILRP